MTPDSWTLVKTLMSSGCCGDLCSYPGRQVVGKYTPMKYKSGDPRDPFSPREAGVYVVRMRDDADGLEYETIVKIAPSHVVRVEVCLLLHTLGCCK